MDDVERPDYLLIDLDPTEGTRGSYVRKIALVVNEVMDELGLASFPKTSGATGLHILVPIKPELRFPDVRRFAKALAQEVERRIDDQEVATTTWKVADRQRRVRRLRPELPRPDDRLGLLDPADAGRPRLGAASWDEVADVDPAAFTIETMRDRVAEVGDLTKGMWKRKASLVPRFADLELEPPAGD